MSLLALCSIPIVASVKVVEPYPDSDPRKQDFGQRDILDKSPICSSTLISLQSYGYEKKVLEIFWSNRQNWSFFRDDCSVWTKLELFILGH